MRKITILLLFSSFTLLAFSKVWIPEKPYPPRLVVDLAGMLTSGQVASLEQKVDDFSRATTKQISIVTVPSLHGEDKAMVATEIIQSWGIGQADKDNGIIILIKPKTPDERGEVQIATGYGLEGVIPDATCNRIVDHEIIPKFKEGKYYEGIDSAVNVIMKLSLGEFSAKAYNEKTKPKGNPGSIIPIIVILFIILGIFGGGRNSGRRTFGRNLPFWILLSMLASNSSRGGGSWGGFSSGSGSFGGGGGFGGFGGGGAGGGGAGGSW
jgi:uncharacterized protein